MFSPPPSGRALKPRIPQRTCAQVNRQRYEKHCTAWESFSLTDFQLLFCVTCASGKTTPKSERRRGGPLPICRAGPFELVLLAGDCDQRLPRPLVGPTTAGRSDRTARQSPPPGSSVCKRLRSRMLMRYFVVALPRPRLVAGHHHARARRKRDISRLCGDLDVRQMADAAVPKLWN